MSHDTHARLEDGALRFSMHGPERTLHVSLQGAALQQYFGASADPQSWLAAYQANFRVIHAVAQLKSQQDGGTVRLDTADFNEESLQRLREAAGGGQA